MLRILWLVHMIPSHILCCVIKHVCYLEGPVGEVFLTGGGEDYTSKPEKVLTIFLIMMTPPSLPPFPLRRLFLVSIFLLVVCALNCYVEYLYRHIFLDDTSNNIKVTQNLHPPFRCDICRTEILAAAKLVSGIRI